MVFISVICGSVRSEREGIKAALFVVEKLKERGVDVVLIDPKEHSLPLLDKMYKEYENGQAPQDMQWIHEQLASSDGFVIVSAEYNHSIPSALKNLLDHFQQEYFFKPSGIVSYSVGGFGGVRGALTLRTILPELGMPTIPTIFAISKIHTSLDENGKALDDSYNQRIGRFLDELLWYVDALKKKREEGVPY